MRKTMWMTMLALCLFAIDAHAAGLDVHHAWVRLPPPVSDTAAAYMQFHNPAARDVRIVGVSADVAMSAMMHSMADGTMKALPTLTVPAGGRVAFAPGGMHIMLMGLKHPLSAGETVHIELRYADGSRQRMTAVVRDARPDAGMGHMGGMPGM
jgi:hypothetical protein